MNSLKNCKLQNLMIIIHEAFVNFLEAACVRVVNQRATLVIIFELLFCLFFWLDVHTSPKFDDSQQDSF